MIKGKIYRCTVEILAFKIDSKKKIQLEAGSIQVENSKWDQLPNQFPQGIRLKINTKPTAYSM